MKRRNTYLLIVGLLISLFVVSCKKETQNSISTLFTSGVWQLGSIREYKYLGDLQTSADTIRIDSTQLFTFNKDMTCTYRNFDNRAGIVKGNWELSDTRLYLKANITYPQVTTAGTTQPFINAHIINIGDFSLVLETGDIQTYYTAADSRTIRRYGFVRIKPVATN
jgi:hypothetical protein